MLQGFGGGILAHRQSKEISRFYNLQPRRDKTLDILAHNATTIRNLAEIRHRENVPAVELQPRAHGRMVMTPVSSQPLPSGEGRRVIADVKDIKRPKAMSVTDKIKQKLQGGSAESPQANQTPEMPASFSAFNNFVAAEEPGLAKLKSPVPSSHTPTRQKQSVDEEGEPSEAKLTTEQFLTKSPAGSDATFAEGTGAAQREAQTKAAVSEEDAVATDEAVIEKVPSKDEPPPRLDAEESASSEADQSGSAKPEKPNRKISSMFNKLRGKVLPEDGNAVASSMAELKADEDKAAEDHERIQDTLPQIAIIEGPMSDEEKVDAIKRYQAMQQKGGADQLTMLKAAKARGALEVVSELSSARTHSLSEDTVLIARPVTREPHEISAHPLVRSGTPAPAHALAQDKVINAKPTKRGAHRLSADSMIPVRIAAPGHYLDADPVVSGPQQLFSHELLDDVVVQQQNNPPRPHDLELDRKPAVLQKQMQGHDLHEDVAVPGVPKSTEHGLHSDVALLTPKARPAHELHSDEVIASGSSARGGHDLTHDVRLLSPSGAIRDPHSVDEDEVIKETAAFRRSPHPEAMVPGNWVPSPSLERDNISDLNNPIASLNASLGHAFRALGELNRAVRSPSTGKENTGDGV